MRNRIDLLAAAICLVGGSFLAATPAPASQAPPGDCDDVVGTYCPTPGAMGYCMIGDWKETITCTGGHVWVFV